MVSVQGNVRPHRTGKRTSRGTDLSAKWIKVPFCADVKNERAVVCADDIVRLFMRQRRNSCHLR